MTHPPGGATSRGFELLHPDIQRWVWQRRWSELRQAQEQAIQPILDADGDLIICAATAAGKTEAAFLPICTTLLKDREHPGASGPSGGLEVVYVSPLKALINDQWNRLDGLCDDLEIPVHRWHGDVSASRKAQVFKKPAGILVITPESLEALFVTRGPSMAQLMAGLRYIVVDEMHAFLANPRGAQLQSLLHRLDLAVRRRVPRIGLSATLGDMDIARAFLRPGDADAVHVIKDAAGGADVRLQVRGYLRQKPQRANRAQAEASPEPALDDDQDTWQIADHLFSTLRGSTNLIFANRRGDVELYADRLAHVAHRAGVPSDFLPHHGSLSREARENVETRLREGTRPTTAVCTSTLEMGIDIGAVSAVAQLGAPPTVAALRQRLGRSGRRPGEIATLRAYITEDEVTAESSPLDAIRAELLQSLASVELLLENWFEPQNDNNLHLSTLIQQTLSLVAQHSGVKPADAYGALCLHGPFRQVDSRMFAQLLRDLGAADLLMQSSDGLLLLGVHGEQVVNHYSFYAAFSTLDEYRLVAEGSTLGSLPIVHAIELGTRIIFNGRRWQVVAVHARDKVIELVPSGGGRPPAFSGLSAATARDVHHRMLMLYLSDAVPAYLDATGQRLLDEGRANFRRWDLHQYPVMRVGRDTALFPWRGDRIHETIAALLAQHGFKASVEGTMITVADAGPDDVHQALLSISDAGPPDPIQVSAQILNKIVDKWDEYLGDDLLNAAVAARSLDLEGAIRAVEQLLHLWPDHDPALAPAAAKPASSNPRAGTADPPLPLGEAVYSVVDVETTGLSPALGHRIVEIAIVRMSGSGQVLDRYTTLVNPRRHPGPTRIHGLTPADLRDAPTFVQIADDITERLAGTVVVAHNAPFDLSFMDAELGRLGLRHVTGARLCTLQLAHRVAPHLPRHTLAACCEDLKIDIAQAHQALADAEATAELLTHYLDDLAGEGATTLADLGVATPGTLPALDLPPSATQLPRTQGPRRPPPNMAQIQSNSSAGEILGFAAARAEVPGAVTPDEQRELELYAAQWNVPADDQTRLWESLGVR